jgi:hypothetical protein
MSGGDRFRAAARAYLAYGIVYWIGGLWLLSQGVGVMGGVSGGETGAGMLKWGLIGLVPLVVIPLLLSRPWSLAGGRISRRAFAWLIALLLAIRAWRVGRVALHGDAATVAAPWGGVVTFQAGAVVFLAVTVAALAFVVRAAWGGDDGARAAHPGPAPAPTSRVPR